MCSPTTDAAWTCHLCAADLPAGSGSIIGIIATDAPILGDQCRRLALHASMGLARVGGGCSDTSGDIFLAFSTANRTVPAELPPAEASMHFSVRTLMHMAMTPLYLAAAEAIEEAILNALLAAETTVGRDGNTAHALTPELLLGSLDEARAMATKGLG